MWFLDFFALIVVSPFDLSAPKITALLHWAEPFFSKKLIDLSFVDPFIINGSVKLSFNLNFAPNLVRGSAILLKSLFDKLLSPIILIG